MERALDDFMSKTIESDEKLEKITNYIKNHCNTNPEDVTWSNVGSLNYLNEQLDNIIEFFNL